MKLFLRKSFFTSLVVMLVLMSVVPGVVGAQSTSKESKEVNDLAEKLEFIFEEAMIKDEIGNPIGIDMDKIEKEFGEIPPELEKLNKTGLDKDKNCYEENLKDRIGLRNAYVDCLQDQLSDFFGDFIPTSLIVGIMSYINDKDYAGAAKKIIRAGFKGSVWGIAGTIGWTVIECHWEK